jgi:hypothetical protein
VAVTSALKVSAGIAGFVLAISALAGCTAQASPKTPVHPAGSAAPVATPSPSKVQCDPTLRDPLDRGPREFATGTVIRSATGRAIAYKVASGDAELAIADRFCLSLEALNDLNARRHCLGAAITPGDVYNLDLATIDTVGSLGGRVCHNVVY